MVCRIFQVAALLLAVQFSFACAKPEPHDPLLGKKLSADAKAPLGGASLDRHRHEMKLASRDLSQFHTTMADLLSRRDLDGRIRFTRFLESYLAEHLELILARSWQSDHPELAGTDANLRVMYAEVLIQMGKPYRVQDVIAEIRNRYPDQTRILVEMPAGEQLTLAAAIKSITKRMWRIRRPRAGGA